MTIMSKNPAQYGLDAIQPDPAMKYDVVKVNYPVDLRLVADFVEVSEEKMVDLKTSTRKPSRPFRWKSAWRGDTTKFSRETHWPALRANIAQRNGPLHRPTTW